VLTIVYVIFFGMVTNIVIRTCYDTSPFKYLIYYQLGPDFVSDSRRTGDLNHVSNKI
jgi:hypothetical protein